MVITMHFPIRWLFCLAAGIAGRGSYETNTELLESEVMEQILNYWKARLANAPTLELANVRPRPEVRSHLALLYRRHVVSMAGDHL